MTVGTELAPGPNAVDITPTKDAGIMKEIKVILRMLFNMQCALCWGHTIGSILREFYPHVFMTIVLPRLLMGSMFSQPLNICRWRGRGKASHGQGTRCMSTTLAHSLTGKPTSILFVCFSNFYCLVLLLCMSIH